MKTCLLAAALLAAPLPVLADTLDDLKEAGTLRVAIGNEPPFTSIAPDGRVSGAAPDVARAVFAALGVADLEATVLDAEALLVPASNPKGFRSYADFDADPEATLGAPRRRDRRKVRAGCRRAARPADRRARRAIRAEDGSGRAHRRLFPAGAVAERSSGEIRRRRA